MLIISSGLCQINDHLHLVSPGINGWIQGYFVKYSDYHIPAFPSCQLRCVHVFLWMSACLKRVSDTSGLFVHAFCFPPSLETILIFGIFFAYSNSSNSYEAHKFLVTSEQKEHFLVLEYVCVCSLLRVNRHSCLRFKMSAPAKLHYQHKIIIDPKMRNVHYLLIIMLFQTRAVIFLSL